MAASKPLANHRIAVPESRRLDLFADMLESRGAELLRCPLVAIHDAPDPEPVEAWLREFAEGGHDDLILLTGEGVRRLLGFAERAGGGLRERFVSALAEVRTITRGPKPAAALREIGLRADLPAAYPTTDGVLETLASHDLTGRVVGVQRYGTEPNEKLMGFLERAGATPRPVAPYVYADATEDAQVVSLIEALTAGRVDAIAFTSSAQVRRLFAVARGRDLEAGLQTALDNTVVAAVGPLVAAVLRERGVEAAAVPEARYFMKPLVNELTRALARD